MSKRVINELLDAGAFNNLDDFGSFLTNSDYKKRYSIMKVEYPYPVGGNIYKTTCCFFVYKLGYLLKTFYCEISGYGKEMKKPQINCYLYPCNDVGRADDWEWVDVK